MRPGVGNQKFSVLHLRRLHALIVSLPSASKDDKPQKIAQACISFNMIFITLNKYAFVQ